MITRTYKTKEDCARLMVQEMFNCIPSRIIEKSEEYYEQWNYVSKLDEDDYNYDEEEDYGYVEEPMWDTWFMPSDSYMQSWIEDNKETVMDIGFTLIYENCYEYGCEDELFALGIDGAGYNFYEHHWIPLYEALGFKWHDEE